MAVYASSYTANLARGKTCAVVSGSADGSYPAANLVDGDVTLPAKLTGTTGIWRIDMGAPVTITLAAILNHNLTAALAGVLVCGNDTGTHSDAMLYTQTFTIPADRADGVCTNPGLVITTPAAARYHYLKITVANGAAVAIGEIWLGTSIELDVPHGLSVQPDEHVSRLVTPAGMELVYEAALPGRLLDASVALVGSSARAAYAALIDAAHRTAYPWLLWPYSATNDVWLVRFVEAPAIAHEAPDAWTAPLAVREVSMGEPL